MARAADRAIDGTIMSVADSAANLAVYGKQRGGPRAAPATRSCGCWPWSARHPDRDRRRVPARLLRRDHLHAFAAAQPARRDAPAGRPELRRRLPGRADRGNQGGLPDPRPHRERRPQAPVLRGLPDGSWLSRFGGISVRVIDAEITVTTSAGRSRDGCRLITTLTDPARYPPATWQFSTTNAGKSRPPTSSSSPRSSAAASCAPAPRRHRAGDLRPPRHLPGPAHRHRRRRGHRSGHRPRPGQFHHRPGHRPRPGDPGRRRRRRHAHRPRRAGRPPRLAGEARQRPHGPEVRGAAEAGPFQQTGRPGRTSCLVADTGRDGGAGRWLLPRRQVSFPLRRLRPGRPVRRRRGPRPLPELRRLRRRRAPVVLRAPLARPRRRRRAVPGRDLARPKTQQIA